MKGLKILSGFILAAALPAACMHYDQWMYLYYDGSGTVRVYYTGGGFEGTDGTPVLPFTEAEIVASYGGPNLAVRDVVVEPETEEYYPSVTYAIDFDDVADLNGRGVFAVRDKFYQTFYLNDLGDKVSFMQTISFTMDVGDTTDLEDYEFEYELVCPFDVTDTNGALSGDGEAVTWSYTLSDLINNDVDMTATFKKHGGLVGYDLEIYVVIIIAVITVFVAPVLILLILVTFALTFALSKRFRKAIVEFFGFKRTVGPFVVKVLHVIAVPVITVCGILLFITGLVTLLSGVVNVGIIAIVAGIALVVIGYPLQRAAYEFYVLLFNAREALDTIKNEKNDE
jgi:hypothetical protein